MNKTFLRKWLQLSCLWIIIALVPVGRVYLFDPLLMQAWFYIILLLIGLLFCPLLILWIHFLQKKNCSWIIMVLIQLIFAVALSLLFYYEADEGYTGMKMRISSYTLQHMPAVKQVGFHLFSGSSYTVFTSLMMLSGLALLIEYNEQLRIKTISESNLKLRLLTSQVKALQSELQPHFLFNTLHAASSLMETDITKAQKLIERLSFLLRNYLDIINRQFYSVAEEMEFLHEYIEVQELRHDGRIELQLHIPDDYLLWQVPVILLQPVIENSVKHGWTDRGSLLMIEIIVEKKDQYCVITVKDNGHASNQMHRTGIGIRNLKERIDVLYNGDFSFTEGTSNGYCSQIMIPLQL